MNDKRWEQVKERIQNDNIISEKDLSWVCRTLNNSNKTTQDIIFDFFYEHGKVNLEQEQIQKGFDWLWDKYQTPTGQERKNNPFGLREERALKNFSHIELADFANAGNYHVSYYVPVYDVYAKDGYGFQYRLNQGQPYIIG